MAAPDGVGLPGRVWPLRSLSTPESSQSRLAGELARERGAEADGSDAGGVIQPAELRCCLWLLKRNQSNPPVITRIRTQSPRK